MGDAGEEQISPQKTLQGLRRAGLEVGLSQAELWSRYFALGGMATPQELASFLEGLEGLAPHEYDVLVHALNERSMEMGSTRRWPYSEET